MNTIKEIKIELTNYCYRNCIHCSSEAVDHKYTTLDVKIIKDIINMGFNMGVESIVFTGGEATLYPGLEDVIKYTKSLGLTTKLYTMCNPDDLNVLKLKKLDLLGLDEIIYSLSYQLTTDNIVNYNNIKIFINNLINKTDLTIGFHYVITNKTIDDAGKIIELANSFSSNKINKLSFLRYVPHGKGDYSLLPTEDQMIKFKELIKEININNPDLIRLGSPFNILNITNTECTAASDTIIVGYDGQVYPCDAMKYFDYLGSGGNIYKNSLEEIYNSEYFQDIRDFKCYVSNECLQCHNYSICEGGCLGQKMVHNFQHEDGLTWEWYELNAKRTMRKFETTEDMIFNRKTGIFGESGELFDNFKKFYTHGVSDEKKQELKEIMVGEIGDIIWYIAAPLATSFNFTFDDIVAKILNVNSFSKRKIDVNLIKEASKLKDPLCPYNKKESLPIGVVEEKININNYDIYKEIDDYILLMARLVTSTNKDDVLNLAAQLLLFLGRIAKCELGLSLEMILQYNIYKLKNRFPIGFSDFVADSRISFTKKYKLEEEYKKQD